MVNYSGYNTILVVSHRRSGTHFTIDSIRHNFPSVNNQFITLERILPNHQNPMNLDEFKSYLDNKSEKIIIKTHLTPFEIDKIAYPDVKKIIQSIFDRSRIVYVVRDGRDVLNSLFYYVSSFSKRTEKLTFTEFLKQSYENKKKINRVEYWQLHVKSWLAQENNIFMLKYESLAQDFNDVVQQLERYLEIQKNQQIYKPELKSKSSSAVSPRKGLVGDYKQNFSEDDIAFFNHTAGDLLKNLGYE
ncbi:sulfotransferase domain-containing protein [Dapis sp. BLCC M229]|uniref:sulfotransferase domain-containing protein n=1 Tax=Dapis sp. BLCC M229 TaxID=3400188 RepID=UPI003CF26F0D